MACPRCYLPLRGLAMASQAGSSRHIPHAAAPKVSEVPGLPQLARSKREGVMMELVRDPALVESPCLRLRVGRRDGSAGGTGGPG